MDEGMNKANVATMAPPQPATFQPIKVPSIEPGPGATRATAKISMNSRALIHL
jgi:hypothetical protein